MNLTEPEAWAYTSYDESDAEYFDQDRYEKDVAEYQRECTRWKPWSYSTVSLSNDIDRYAHTCEEAEQLADEALRRAGILLVPGDVINP